MFTSVYVLFRGKLEQVRAKRYIPVSVKNFFEFFVLFCFELREGSQFLFSDDSQWCIETSSSYECPFVMCVAATQQISCCAVRFDFGKTRCLSCRVSQSLVEGFRPERIPQ